MPGRDWQDMPFMGNTTFSQLIDHGDPDLGTFEQFYYYSTEFWGGPGSPVILVTPGEVSASGHTSYLSTGQTTGERVLSDTTARNALDGRTHHAHLLPGIP